MADLEIGSPMLNSTQLSPTEYVRPIQHPGHCPSQKKTKPKIVDTRCSSKNRPMKRRGALDRIENLKESSQRRHIDTGILSRSRKHRSEGQPNSDLLQPTSEVHHGYSPHQRLHGQGEIAIGRQMLPQKFVQRKHISICI